MSPGLDPRSAEADGRALAVFKRFAMGVFVLANALRKGWSPLLLSLPQGCTCSGKPNWKLNQGYGLCPLLGFMLRLWSICGLPLMQSKVRLMTPEAFGRAQQLADIFLLLLHTSFIPATPTVGLSCSRETAPAFVVAQHFPRALVLCWVF